jgi:hypothetical protein
MPRCRPQLSSLICLLILTVTPSRAEVIITSVSDQVTILPGGLVQYNYTLTNQPTSTLPAVLFNLNVDTKADLKAIKSGAGWTTTYSPGAGFIEWDSPGPFTDLVPGSSGTFSFVSPLGPSDQSFFVVGLNDQGIDFNSGTTSAPGSTAAVPEPSSLAMWGIGVLGLVAAALAWRKWQPMDDKGARALLRVQ